MFNDQAGKNFQGDLTDRSFGRDDAGRDAVKVLVSKPLNERPTSKYVATLSSNPEERRDGIGGHIASPDPDPLFGFTTTTQLSQRVPPFSYLRVAAEMASQEGSSGDALSHATAFAPGGTGTPAEVEGGINPNTDDPTL